MKENPLKSFKKNSWKFSFALRAGQFEDKCHSNIEGFLKFWKKIHKFEKTGKKFISRFAQVNLEINSLCVFIHYQLKIHDGNCLRERTIFQNLKCIFLKINFFNSTTSNVHNSARNKARDFLLVSFCREFYLVYWAKTKATDLLLVSFCRDLTSNQQCGTLRTHTRSLLISAKIPMFIENCYKKVVSLFFEEENKMGAPLVEIWGPFITSARPIFKHLGATAFCDRQRSTFLYVRTHIIFMLN